jgi:pimeloyl-ACP methyl ester carboxylesterase
VRHRLAATLASELGYRTATVEGTSHFIAKENPAAVAQLIREALER